MYEGPIIDCDVHHNRANNEVMLQHLPRRWREFVSLPGNGRTIRLAPAVMNADAPEGTNKRLDTFPPEGGIPGSSYSMLRRQLLDAYNIEALVLTFDTGQESGFVNGDFNLAICRAMNDWTAQTWLEEPGDDRLYGGLLVPAHMPEKGAAEIRRMAANSRFASALFGFNALGHPIGHPVYHPIHKAAAEAGFPIQFHSHGGELWGGDTPLVSGGTPHNSRFDVYNFGYQSMANHLTSLIVHGVFEKYPDFKVVVNEAGLSWLPWLVASLESNYAQMRRESKWVRRPPLEYLQGRVFFGTQPCEATPQDRENFVEHMSLIEGIEEMLLFTSDYPHWDGDSPTYIEAILPKAWHEKMFHENARKVLRLQTTKSSNRRAQPSAQPA